MVARVSFTLKVQINHSICSIDIHGIEFAGDVKESFIAHINCKDRSLFIHLNVKGYIKNVYRLLADVAWYLHYSLLHCFESGPNSDEYR